MTTQSDEVLNIIFDGDEVTWQSIIYDLVKSGDINPWDVDIAVLSTKYMEMLKQLKETDFRISGKVVLAAAILLRMKSNRLMGSDMAHFEDMFKEPESEMMEDYLEPMDLNEQLAQLEQAKQEKPTLIPRTPQPRERKVTIFDLVDALQHTLDTRKKKAMREIPNMPNVRAPERTRDITEIIREVFSSIQEKFGQVKKDHLLFDELTPSSTKEDKIATFVPLLHLTNQRKIDIEQEGHFQPIFIKMLKK